MSELDTSFATSSTSRNGTQQLVAPLVDLQDEAHSNPRLPAFAQIGGAGKSHLSRRYQEKQPGFTRRTRNTGFGCDSCRKSRKSCNTTPGAPRTEGTMGWCDRQAGKRTNRPGDVSNGSHNDEVDVPWWSKPVQWRSGESQFGMVFADGREAKTIIGSEPSPSVAGTGVVAWDGVGSARPACDGVLGLVKGEPAGSSEYATNPPLEGWDTWQNDGGPGDQYGPQAFPEQPPWQSNGYLEPSQAQDRVSARTSRPYEWWTQPLNDQNAVFRSQNFMPGMNTQCPEMSYPSPACSFDPMSDPCPINNQYDASLFAEGISFGTIDVISLGLGVDQFPLNPLDDCSGSFGPGNSMVPGAFMDPTNFDHAFKQMQLGPGHDTDNIGAEWAAPSLAGGYNPR